jgi:hypothetical protein
MSSFLSEQCHAIVAMNLDGMCARCWLHQDTSGTHPIVSITLSFGFLHRNFDFLQGLEDDFTKEFSASRISRAKALGMQKKFLPSIRSKMHYYNINRTKLTREQKVQDMLEKMEDMKSLLDRNIRLMVRRQEGQLDEMLEKSNTMKRDSTVFKKKAEIMLLSTRRKQYARYCFYLTFGLGIIYLLLAAGCGFRFESCHAKTSSS